jgi:Domain of unknown function (DUF4266)
MTRTGRTVLLILGALAVATWTTGCATVQPWERARLADPCMVFDYNGAQADFASHWQTAREGSSGGFGIQGGGCGCK